MVVPLKNDPERDRKLIVDYLSTTEDGKSWAFEKVSFVSGKYGMGNTRLYQIISKYSVPRRGYVPTKESILALQSFQSL